jgi:Rrf2 family protein
MAKIVSLSEAASIALHAMILMARHKDEHINVDKIAEATNSSRHHIAKVMQRLAKEGYVGSLRGPTGGFYLLKKPEEITLLEVYEAIEGKISESKCPMEKPVCNFGQCFLNNIVHDLSQTFKKYMQQHTLKDYA